MPLCHLFFTSLSPKIFAKSEVMDMIIDKEEIEALVERLLDPIVKSRGITLVDVELSGLGGRKVLKVFIDKPGGVTISDCQKISGELSVVLDDVDPIPGSYDLEVSSPGLDRVLKKERELRWAVGKKVRIITLKGERRGVLSKVTNELIEIDRAGDVQSFARDEILKIQLDEIGE